MKLSKFTQTYCTRSVQYFTVQAVVFRCLVVGSILFNVEDIVAFQNFFLNEVYEVYITA